MQQSNSRPAVPTSGSRGQESLFFIVCPVAEIATECNYGALNGTNNGIIFEFLLPSRWDADGICRKVSFYVEV